MKSFAHTGSTFKKLLQHDISSINSSIQWRKLRINIAYSSVEIKLWKFQWRHLRIPEVLSKKLLKPDWYRIQSFIHCRKLRIYIAYSSGEIKLWNFNDVIRAYRKYFWKNCLQMKCVEFDSVLPATSCLSISLTVPGLFTFKRIYDVIFVNRK